MLIVAAIDSNPIAQTVIILVLQSGVCIYVSVKKPFIRYIDNLRVIVDKIINILIMLIFFVLTADEKVSFLTKHFRIRFFERTFLMFLFVIKIIFMIGMIAYRVVISLKEDKLKRQEEKELAQLKEQQQLKK